MIFKYRGTTIRLFSRKLFILVTLGIGAVLAVFTLHEIITFNASYSRDFTPKSNGFHLDQPQNSPHLQGTVTNFNEDETKTMAKKQNTNNNIPKESLLVHEIHRPTVTISQNKTVSPEIHRLRDIVKAVNEAEYIRNADKFGTTLSQKSIVIIVQVHNRGDYFSYLLKSLSRAKGIEDVLLIISHDYYSEEINRHVESIEFCKVSGIFTLF